MGKGARSRAQHADKKIIQQQKQAVEVLKQKKDKLIMSIIGISLAIVVLIAGLVYMFYYANGNYLRDDISASSETYEIDNAVMTYLFKTNYVNMQSAYSGYFFEYSGVNPYDSLKNQTYTEDQTWFDSILDTTKMSVDEVIPLAEQAKADGITLTEEDYVTLEENLANVDPYFLEDGVQKSDVEKAVEMSLLAQKYNNKFIDELEITDEEIEDYYAENENNYKTASYLSYSITYEGEENNITKEEAEQRAEELENASSEEEFLEIVEEIVIQMNPDLNEEEIATMVDSAVFNSSSYVSESEMSDWIFDEEREIGETHIVEDADFNTITTSFITAPASRDETVTEIFRHILFSFDQYDTAEEAKAAADDILARYNEDPTEDNFSTLATGYTQDTASASNGGLYQGVTPGTMVEPIDTWLFDDAREVAEVEIVETEFGYHIMYYVGEGKEAWMEQIHNDISLEEFNTKLEELQEVYPITYDEEALSKLPV